MLSAVAPRDRCGPEIALICALPVEAECVQEAFDKFWEDEDKEYGKAAGDENKYTPGVVACTMSCWPICRAWVSGVPRR